MAKFTVKQPAHIRYSMTTWEGQIEYKGETINYRYSEDDNGAELFILDWDKWAPADLEENFTHQMIWAACMEWGSPEEFGDMEEKVEIDDFIIEDYCE